MTRVNRNSIDKKPSQRAFGVCVFLSALLVTTPLLAYELEKKLERGVLRIVVVEKGGGLLTGSGFLLNSDGIAVTNYHVTESLINHSAENAYIYDGGVADSDRRSFKVLWYSRDKDLSLIKIEGLRSKTLPLELADSEANEISKGIRVWTLGFPGASDTAGLTLFSQEAVMKVGILSIKRTMFLTGSTVSTRMFEHTATVNSGISGSPLFDNCGRVIGINQSKAVSRVSDRGKIDIAEGTFWAVRAVELVDTLKAQRIKYTMRQAPCERRQLLAGTSVAPALSGESAPRFVPVWLQVAIAAGLLLSIGMSAVLWRSMRLRPAHEKMSEYVRREVSRVFRRFPGDPKEAVHRVPARSMASGSYGSLIGLGLMRDYRLDILEEPKLIGRGLDADLQIDDERVGRRHALIGWDSVASKFYLVDQGSVNGTFVAFNQALVAYQKTFIESGAEIYFADRCFLFRLITSSSARS